MVKRQPTWWKIILPIAVVIIPLMVADFMLVGCSKPPESAIYAAQAYLNSLDDSTMHKSAELKYKQAMCLKEHEDVKFVLFRSYKNSNDAFSELARGNLAPVQNVEYMDTAQGRQAGEDKIELWVNGQLVYRGIGQ